VIELLLGFTAGVVCHQVARRWNSRKDRKNATAKGVSQLPTLSLSLPEAQIGILMMSLPPVVSASLFSELDSDTIQKITVAITRLPKITSATRDEITRKFCSLLGIKAQNFAQAAEEEPAIVAKAMAAYLREKSC
jgi:flagellar motor switch protein FliG